MKYLFWFFQFLYFIILSIVPYLAWTNQLTFREGTEESGKIFLTAAALFYFIVVEIIMFTLKKKNNRVA